MRQQCDGHTEPKRNASGRRITRSEFAADADINVFLRRYGAPVPGQFQAGEVDYDVGLLDAKLLVRESREAFGRLPAGLRSVYPTWELLFDAAARGEVVVGPDGPVVKVKAPSEPVV